MPKKKTDLFPIVPYFTWTHFATDGKLENIGEVLSESPIERICLNILDPSMDDVSEFLADKQEILSRLARCKQVISRCRRDFDLIADLVLPGLGSVGLYNSSGKKGLAFLYSHAPQTKAKIVWMDEKGLAYDFQAYYELGRDVMEMFQKRKGHRVSKKRLGELHQRIASKDGDVTPRERKIISDFEMFEKRWLLDLTRHLANSFYKHSNKSTLGLIGGDSPYESDWQLDILETLSKNRDIFHVRTSHMDSWEDYDRTDILNQAIHLSVGQNATGYCRAGGYLNVWQPSCFNKSSESMQMELQLNLLFGRDPVLLDCFDDAGTDPSGSPFLKMTDNRKKLIRKLGQLMPQDAISDGIRIVQKDDFNRNHWATLFMRMGFPVTVHTPDRIDCAQRGAVSIIMGEVVRSLTRDQIESLFTNGVLLDIVAARDLADMGFSESLGVTFGKEVVNVCYEIISDQRFAAPFYGHRTDMSGFDSSSNHSYLAPLKPKSKNTRTLTTLLQKNKLPNTPGMSYSENPDRVHYCAILPYAVQSGCQSDLLALLTVQRQRHFHDLFTSLGRQPLPCYVENSPDLVPFYFADPKGRRVILALLNVSFDWAIDTRIRLGELPERITQVRELDDSGRLQSYPDLQLIRAGHYSYIDLTPDAAVPPMQMGIFVLE